MTGIEQVTRQREIVIQLTSQEIANAETWAKLRASESIEDGFQHWGPRRDLVNDILGFQGELAAERYLGLPGRNRFISYWQGRSYHFDTLPPGAIQVRVRSVRYYGLSFRPGTRDCPWCPYIHAFIRHPDEGVVHLVGWATGEQIQAEGRLIEKTRQPFFALSAERLHALPKQPHSYFYLDQTLCRKMQDHQSRPPGSAHRSAGFP